MGKPRKNFRDPAEVQSVMLRMGVDFVAMSFVRTRDDVDLARGAEGKSLVG